MHATEKLRKVSVSTTSDNSSNLVIQDHYLTKKHEIFSLSKLTRTENYLHLILANNTQRTSKVYYEKLFHKSNLISRNIYIITCIATVD